MKLSFLKQVTLSRWFCSDVKTQDDKEKWDTQGIHVGNCIWDHNVTNPYEVMIIVGCYTSLARQTKVNKMIIGL